MEPYFSEVPHRLSLGKRSLKRHYRSKLIESGCLIILAATVLASCSRKSPEEFRAIAVSVDSLIATGDTLAALELAKQLVPEHQTGQTTSTTSFAIMLNLAGVYARTGFLNESARIYEYLLAKHLSVDSTTIDQSIAITQEYGLLRSEMGADSSARQLLGHALALRESLYTMTHWRFAIGLSALAIAEMRGQSWAHANELLERSIGIYHSWRPGADSLLLLDLINLATVRAELGDHLGETRAMEDVLQLLDDTHLNSISRALAHNALALYFDRIGDLELGLHHQATSASLTEQVHGPRHATTLLTRSNLLISYYSVGDSASLHRELTRLREDLAQVHLVTPSLADALTIAGSLYLNLNQLDEAHPLLSRAKEAYKMTGTNYTREHADCLQALAQCEQRKGNYAAALNFGRESLDIARQQFLDIFDNLAESESYSFSRRLRDISDFYLSLLKEQNSDSFTSSHDFAHTVLTQKLIVTDGLLERAVALNELRDSYTLLLLDSLKSQRRMLTGLVARGLQGEIAILRNIERLQRVLSQSSKRYETGRNMLNVSMDDICRALPQGTVLIEYYRYIHTDISDVRSPRYVAVVLDQFGHRVNVDLGDAAEIEDAVSRWADDLAAPQMLTLDRTRHLTVAVQTLIWSPVETYTNEADLIVFCPDAILSRFAFHSIISDSLTYLVEKVPVHYLSAARDVLGPTSVRDISGKQTLLAVADPDFTNTSTSTPLAALPYAREEVLNLADAWQKQNTGVVNVLLGQEASEHEFTRACADATVIYIASHGEIGVPDADLDHELMLAGQSLLLAGDTDGKYDGVLTATEIAGLDLSRAELVVLSACETAGGLQFEGEGTFSLRRSFQMAGAHTVISTLWRVDDRETAQLMSELFISKDVSLPIALQTATKRRLAQLRSSGNALGDHPFLWAGIFASGNWFVR